MASISKRGKTYRITVSNGRAADGTQIRETATFVPDPTKTEHQNKKALEKFAYEFEERVRNGKYLKGEKMTYKEYSSIWRKEYVSKQLSVTTYERYEGAFKRTINPAIGHLKLAQITPLHLQYLYRDMGEKGYEQNGKHKTVVRQIKRCSERHIKYCCLRSIAGESGRLFLVDSARFLLPKHHHAKYMVVQS